MRRRFGGIGLALGIVFAVVACATPESRSPAETDSSTGDGDPYAALRRLSDRVAAMAELARGRPESEVPYGRGEGALHVLRLMRRAIDEEIAWADTDHPWFQVQDERYAKLALGNPDNLYLVARVDDDAEYRIEGRLGTTVDFNVQVYQGYPGIHRPFRARGAVGLEDLVVDADGRSFVIHVGGPRRGPNWIPLEPGSRRILVRFTYGNWADEVAGEVRIVRETRFGTRSEPVPDAVVAERIDSAADYLEDAMTGYLAVVDGLFADLEPNALRPLRQMTGEAGGLVRQASTSGRYAVDDDWALIVSTLPSDAAYQGFQLGTEWFEALDFANQTTSLNTAQAHLSSDGRYHFVVATRDPGVQNWLDASSAPRGQMLLRWQRVGQLGPEHQPRVRLVPFDELRAHLPADEPEFGASLRALQIGGRQSAIAARFASGER